MNILTICTAFPTALITLETSKKVFSCETDSSSKHSENLLINIEKLLIEAQLKLSEIDALGIVIGPGSFTGLRIASATAKAILKTQKKMKAFSIGTLKLLAYAGGGGLAVMDALSGRYFVAQYDANGKELFEPTLVTKEELEELSKDKTILTCEDSPFENSQKIILTAGILAKNAKEMVKNKAFCTENDLSPLYLRKSQAEENLKETNNG